jgi:hypothetical protein
MRKLMLAVAVGTAGLCVASPAATAASKDPSALVCRKALKGQLSDTDYGYWQAFTLSTYGQPLNVWCTAYLQR